MTKTRSSKRALILSALALVMCISMLIGSTFAWFTDTVTSGNNKIVSGNLDVVLEYKTGDMEDWVVVDENTKIFDENALYEPGYTEVVFLRVSNAGSLALKYRMAVNILSETPATNVYDEEFKLSDYLMIGSYFANEYNGVDNWSALIPAMFATRDQAITQVAGNAAKLSEFNGIFSDDQVVLPGDNTAMIGAVVLYMPETVGNEANYKTGTAAPEINLGINLLATQLTHEEDSFGPDYDEDATYPVAATAEELKEALAKGGTVTLTDDITLTEQLSITKDTTINLNGFDLDASANTSRPFTVDNEADLIINAEGSTVAVGNYGLVDLKADFSGTVTINGGTFTGNTDNGSFVKVRGNNGAVINLNSVTVVDDSTNGGSIFNGVGSENVEINVTDCDLTAYAGFTSFEKATFKDTTLNVSWYGICNSNSEDVVIDNCVINVEGDCTASNQANAPAAAIAVSSNIQNFKVTNSVLNSKADAVAVYTSGGSVELVGCTVTGTYGIYHGGYDNRTFEIIVDGAVADATCHGTVATGTDCAHCN